VQRGPRSERSDHSPPDQSAEIAHHGNYRRLAANRQPFWVCGRDTSDRHPDRIECAAVLRAVKVWPGKGRP
jgi:hypothetical protein